MPEQPCKEVAELQTLLNSLKSSQEEELGQFSQQHATLCAIADAFNLICEVVDSSAKVSLEAPAFLPKGPDIKALVAESLRSKSLMTNAALHDALRNIHDASQFQQIDAETFTALIPILTSWLGSPADVRCAYVLVHEGVCAFGAQLLPHKALRREWRSVVASLSNLAEDEELILKASIDDATLRTLIVHIQQCAGI